MADGGNVHDVNDAARQVAAPSSTPASNNPLPGQSSSARLQSQARQHYQSSAFVESLTSAFNSIGIKNVVEAAEFSLDSPTGKVGDGLLVEMSSMDGVVEALNNTVNRLGDINDAINQGGETARRYYRQEADELRSNLAMQSVMFSQQSVLSNERDEVVNTVKTLEKQTDIHKEVRDALVAGDFKAAGGTLLRRTLGTVEPLQNGFLDLIGFSRILGIHHLSSQT